MVWWEILWGVLGILLGCVTLLVISLIRASAGLAVKSWTDAGTRSESEQVEERAA